MSLGSPESNERYPEPPQHPKFSQGMARHDRHRLCTQAAMMHLTNANPGLAASLGAAQGPPLAPISAPVGPGGALGAPPSPLMAPGLASLPSMNGVLGAPTLTSVAVAANGEPGLELVRVHYRVWGQGLSRWGQRCGWWQQGLVHAQSWWGCQGTAFSRAGAQGLPCVETGCFTSCDPLRATCRTAVRESIAWLAASGSCMTWQGYDTWSDGSVLPSAASAAGLTYADAAGRQPASCVDMLTVWITPATTCSLQATRHNIHDSLMTSELC